MSSEIDVLFENGRTCFTNLESVHIFHPERPPAKHILLFIENVKAGNISRIPSKATALK